jgi:hypothetical protein
METEVNRRGLPKVLSLVDSKIVDLLIFPARRSRYKQQHNTEPALRSDFIWRSLGLMTESSHRIPTVEEWRSRELPPTGGPRCVRERHHMFYCFHRITSFLSSRLMDLVTGRCWILDEFGNSTLNSSRPLVPRIWEKPLCWALSRFVLKALLQLKP